MSHRYRGLIAVYRDEWRGPFDIGGMPTKGPTHDASEDPLFRTESSSSLNGPVAVYSMLAQDAGRGQKKSGTQASLREADTPTANLSSEGCMWASTQTSTMQGRL